MLNLSGTYQGRSPITTLVPDGEGVNIIEIVPIKSAHLARAFFLAAAVTVPWTIFVAIALPRHYTAHHYWLGWFGFDVALIFVLAVTGRSLMRGHLAAQRYATAAATMLVVDAWFDVLNAATHSDQLVAVAMAALVELPLAYVCWRIARMEPDTEGRSPRPASGSAVPPRPPRWRFRS